MRVEVGGLLDFLDAGGKSFSIPLFQRPYSWGEMQCGVLWQDIARMSDSEGRHFFGATFYRQIASASDEPVVSLIDGQQRTLTMLLLISALADALDPSDAAFDGGAGASELSADELRRRYLCSLDGGVKVYPSKRDAASFAQALGYELPEGAAGGFSEDGELASLGSQRAISNKAFFAGRIAEGSISPQQLMDRISRFEVVSVEIDENDDEQAIFESFNSKGVPLVVADMVRNYLLLSESADEQKRLYETYWELTQGLFGDDPGSLRLNNALHAWTVIRCKAPKGKGDAECFVDFKRYFLDEYNGDKDSLMNEILSFCKVWAENYRYHAVKKFKSTDWSTIGRKTLVSDRPRSEASQQSREFYAKHYGIPLN